jgi:hypothetical protein
MSEMDVRIDESGFIAAFKTWGGMTGRFLDRRATDLQTKAVADAPVGQPGQGHTPGTLKSSITTYNTYEDTELCARVGTSPEVDAGNIGYGYFVHEGTRPHTIIPKQAKALRFVVGGRIVYATKVNHPGTAPNPYLARFLPEIFE